jgi:outer membrane protein
MQIHKRAIHIFAFVLILCSGSSFAQDSLSLRQAINMAFERSSFVTTLQNTYQNQEFNIRSAKGSLFPTLSLTGGFNRNISSSKGGVVVDPNTGIPYNVEASTRGTNTFSLGANSNVTLYNGFANTRNVDLQEASLTGIAINLERTKTDIMLNVTSSYIDILKKQKIVGANEENLRVSIDQLNAVKVFMEVGKRTLSDVYKQDVLVSQNELKVEQSRNEVNKSKVDLLFVINDNINRQYNIRQNDININYSVNDLRLIVNKTSNTQELVNRAKINRKEYKFVLQDIEINEITLDIAKKNLYFPTITGNAQYNLSGNAIDAIDDSKVLSFGIGLSYPIFQGFSTKVREQIAEVNIKQRREDLNQLVQQFTSDIRKAQYDLETAFKQYEILERSLVSAQQDVLLSEESYRVGLNTLLDVQTAQNNLNSILVSRITALYDFITAKARLDYYTGELNY